MQHLDRVAVIALQRFVHHVVQAVARVVGHGTAAAMRDDPRIVEAYLGALVT